MARGWESKSVEDQQEQAKATAGTRSRPQRASTPDETARRQSEQALQLSRKFVLQQLEAAQNPRHREMLQAALADLNAKLSAPR